MEKLYKLPIEDVNDQEAVIVSIDFSNGDKVSSGDIIYSFETTKAVIEVDSEDEGYIFYLVNLSDEVKVGSGVCLISDNKDFDIKTYISESNEQVSSAGFKLTKKAEAYIKDNNIDISDFDLSGIVKLDSILKLLDTGNQATEVETTPIITFLDENNDLIKTLKNDETIKDLPSDKKIDLYRKAGHSIGENVHIGLGSLIISNKIEIKNNVHIGNDTIVEVPEVFIDEHTRIGSNCDIVASKIEIGPYNRIIDNARVDLSGGRHHDSNLITGRGCLLSSYVNVCRQVKLGENVALSPDSIIFTHSYWQSVLDGYPASYGPVNFENDSWLGAGSYVLPNVSVGEGSVIMSSSVVVNNVKAFNMVGGTPATVIKENLKKNKTHKQINDQIKELFQELFLSFISNQYEAKKEEDLKFTVITESENFVIGLHEINTESQSHLEGCNIVISYDADNSLIMDSSTHIRIKSKEIIGESSKIQNFVTEFLRHKGIRLYHSQ